MHERAFRALVLAALAAAPFGLAGCLDFLPDGLQPRPDYAVARTDVQTDPGTWNRQSTFLVQVNEAQPLEVVITATPEGGGAPLSTRGFAQTGTSVSLEIPDGTWSIEYSVDGYRWETFRGARFDTTPPAVSGLETLGLAPDRSYTIGQGATVESGATIKVVDQDTNQTVATGLPAPLANLPDGVHAYDVHVEDSAGNLIVYPVQVVAGTATQLPEGRLTMGIVARYRTTAALWDITDLTRYMTSAQAQQAAPGYLGSGVGVTPGDERVVQVKDQVVEPGMTTAEAAFALYQWMFDELEYDRARLDQTDLLTPRQTIEAGGGVCRDLAALYVSLLRAADIPARLVAGYLGGNVNGFHAWVEFYGGLAPIGDPTGPKWVPVDVSGIGSSDDPADDAFNVAAMLQAFGVRQPEYLMLRAVTPPQEQDAWASAMTLSESRPPGSSPADLEFENLLSNVTKPETRDLCINRASYFRQFRAGATCSTPRGEHIPDVVTAATQVLDYGVDVDAAPKGARITLEVVYPDTVDTSADSVEFLTYSSGGSEGCPRSASSGRATCTLQM